jgi:hypothetical protein
MTFRVVVRAGEDVSEARRCTACQGRANRRIIENVGKKSYFGLQGLAIADPANGEGEVLNGYFMLAAYVCTDCGHVDFYSGSSVNRKR